MELITVLTCFLAAACAVWAILRRRSRWDGPARPSLTLLRSADGSMAVSASWVPWMAWLERLGRVTVRRAAGLGDDLRHARCPLTPAQFYGLKLLAAIAGGFIWSAVAVELRNFNPLWFLCAATAGFMAPTLWLWMRIRRRNRAIVRLLPEVLDLLSLCVGGGLGFYDALHRVMLVKAFQREPLIEELSLAIQEIKLGKRRLDALRAMANRTNLPEISSFIRTLMQADRMGTPILEALSIHAKDLRDQRFNRVERAVLKAPIKVLLPLVFFIMPCVALLVAGPIILRFMQHNPFAR